MAFGISDTQCYRAARKGRRMGGEYFSQLHVADDRSLGEARIGQELVDEQGNAQILERNGAPGRT